MDRLEILIDNVLIFLPADTPFLADLIVKSNAVHKENISKKPLDSAGSTRPNWSGKQTYTHMIRMNNAAG